MANELSIAYNGSANIYAIIRRRSDGYVWDGSGFVVWADLDIDDYDLPLTSLGGDLYAADMPDDIAGGDYLASFYVRAGATPATTDLRLPGKEFYWTGSAALDPIIGGAEGDITNEALVKAFFDAEDMPHYAHPSDPDDATAVSQGIQVGIDMAEGFANRLARVAGHTNVPLPDTSADFIYLQGLVTKLAGIETFFRYGKKDNPDENAPVNGTYGRFTGLKKETVALLREFFAGKVDGSGATDPAIGVMQSVPLKFGDEFACDENSSCDL